MIGKIRVAIMSIALVILLASSVFAWTAHPLRAGKDDGGSWRLTTIPEHVYNFMVKVPSITIIRKAHRSWDRRWPLGSLSDLPIFEEPLKNVAGVTKALDKIVPSGEVVVVVYYMFINEMVIYCHPNRWEDKEFHENIAIEFNKLRIAFLFMHNIEIIYKGVIQTVAVGRCIPLRLKSLVGIAEPRIAEPSGVCQGRKSGFKPHLRALSTLFWCMPFLSRGKSGLHRVG